MKYIVLEAKIVYKCLSALLDSLVRDCLEN